MAGVWAVHFSATKRSSRTVAHRIRFIEILLRERDGIIALSSWHDICGLNLPLLPTFDVVRVARYSTQIRGEPGKS